MARKPRIEFAGAVYHVMSRGNRQESIFRGDRDNRMFLDTLGEACGRTGWRIHAFVLMGNHYHLLLETPEPNLVDGMRWLQGTYTARFNTRHSLRGHLFQGRYKALPVDTEGNYFQTLASYIHLNPARANLFDLQNGELEDYTWSSYPFYIDTAKHLKWLTTDRVLGSLGFPGDSGGRDEYCRYMKKRVLEISASNKPWELDEDWARIRQGWAFGSDDFKKRMQETLTDSIKGRRRDSYEGEIIKYHDQETALRLLASSLEKLNLASDELPKLKKGDGRKKAIAWLIRKNTCVKNEWIAQNLHMGNASNLSRHIREIDPELKRILTHK